MRYISPILFAAVTLMLTSSPTHAQEEAALDLYVFSGYQNTPEGFDVERNVNYSNGLRAGGGVGVEFSDLLSIRGDFAYTTTGGRETGLVDEDVDFSRMYGAIRLQLAYPVDGNFSPHAFAGGGLVHNERTSDSYSYDVTDSGAVFGVGFRYRIPDSRFSVFADSEGWVYPRSTLGETQFDKMLNVGLTYRAVQR